MKIRKFIFKFIDHDRKTCLEVVVSIHSSKIIEWVHKDNDIEGYANWARDHAKWEKLLKKEVKRIISEKYFTRETKNFGDYYFVDSYMHKKTKKVNMNQGGTEVRKRIVKLMEIYNTKMARGAKPEKSTDVYNYTKIEEHHHFFLPGDHTNKEIKLVKLVEDFIVPQEGLNGATNLNTTANTTAVSKNNAITNESANARTIAGPGVATSINSGTSAQNIYDIPYYNTGPLAERSLGRDIVNNNNQSTRQNTYLPYTNIGTTSLKNTNVIATTNADINRGTKQTGGKRYDNDNDDDYQNRYIKYKKKYVDLKREKHARARN